MDLEKLFNDLTIKADNLEVAMKILPQKDTFYSENLELLNEDCKEIKKLETMVKEAINQHNNELKEEYREVKDIVQNVNEKMLFLLSEIEKIESTNQQQLQKPQHSNVLCEIKSPAPKMFDRQDASAVFSEFNTPRMSIDQYAKSPFLKNKRSTKMQLKFSDFEAEITNEQFEKIPSYMKGRIVLADLQAFLDNVVIKCFNSKYELYYKKRSALKPSDYSLQLFYKEQSSYFEGQKFITLGDLSRIMDKNVDKKDEKFIQCLRFLHIIKEARKKSATCYIWVEK